MACTVLLEVKAQEDKVEALKATFKAILGDTRAYEGCQSVVVKQQQDDPTVMVLIESWDSREHYEKYFAWRQESGALAALGEMLAGPPNLRYFDDVDA